MNISLRRGAATPRPRRKYSAETRRSDAAAATWIFRGDAAAGTRQLGLDRYHGCQTYTQVRGARNRYLDFSAPILQNNKRAGFLTRLQDGSPEVSPESDLSDVTVVDIVGWAPTPDVISTLKNRCTNEFFDVDVNAGGNLVTTDDEVGCLEKYPEFCSNANDVALYMLLEGQADVVYIYADQAKFYFDACAADPIQAENCELWRQFGETFGYIHMGAIAASIAAAAVSPSIAAAAVSRHEPQVWTNSPSPARRCPSPRRARAYPPSSTPASRSFWRRRRTRRSATSGASRRRCSGAEWVAFRHPNSVPVAGLLPQRFHEPNGDDARLQRARQRAAAWLRRRLLLLLGPAVRRGYLTKPAPSLSPARVDDDALFSHPTPVPP